VIPRHLERRRWRRRPDSRGASERFRFLAWSQQQQQQHGIIERGEIESEGLRRSTLRVRHAVRRRRWRRCQGRRGVAGAGCKAECKVSARRLDAAARVLRRPRRLPTLSRAKAVRYPGRVSRRLTPSREAASWPRSGPSLR
jgi:hypothetical protein